MCWVEKSIYLWQREREAVCEPSKTKKLKVKTGASSRSQKTSRWLILSAEEAAEHLQHAHDGASWLWKWSGSGLINRMTFRGGEMWGHVKAWKAKKNIATSWIYQNNETMSASWSRSQSVWRSWLNQQLLDEDDQYVSTGLTEITSNTLCNTNVHKRIVVQLVFRCTTCIFQRIYAPVIKQTKSFR